MIHLVEDPWRYFNRRAGVVLLPLKKLRPTRARPSGIQNAARFMALAYEGKKAKRDPISVSQESDGSYSIVDGNSTYANAMQSGWKSIPALVATKTAYRPRWQETPGYKTVVDDKSTKGILPSQLENKTDTGQSRLDSAWPVAPGVAREKERALPLPSGHSKQREKKVGPTTVNKPRYSPDRTLSVPGQQYGHPTKYDYGSPTRRDMTSAEEDLYEEDPMDDQQIVPGSDDLDHMGGSVMPEERQHKLPPAYRKEVKLDYIKNPSKKIEERMEYRTKGKFDPQAKRYRKYYRQYPQRYKRKGLSKFNTPAERTKAWREEQGQDAKRKGISKEEQAKRRKDKPLRTKTKAPPGSTSKTYASENLMADWDMLGANYPLNWNTTTKKTEAPNQLDQNYGKGQSRDTGVPRTSPGKQKGESQRAPDLHEKHQPGLFTQQIPPAAGVPNVQVNNPTSGSGKVIPLSFTTDLVNNTQQIPDGRQHTYERNNNFQVKQAATMAQILDRVDEEIRLKSRERRAKLVRTDTKNWMWHWKSGQWLVKVQAYKKGSAKNLNKLNLRIACNCPFWMWQGPEHWARQGNYLLGSPRGSAANPVIRDPAHRHPVCKHVYAVLKQSERFFVRPKKSPLRKLGSRFSVDSAASIEIEIVSSPNPARVAQTYLEKQLTRRVAARYLEKKGNS